MSTLRVRNVPDELYQRLQELARQNNRSLGAQVVTLLYAAIDEERRRQQGQALNAIRSRRFTPHAGALTSTELLREDRQR